MVFSPLQRRGDLPRATKVHWWQHCKHNPGLLGHLLNVTWDISQTENESHQLAAASHKTVGMCFIDMDARCISVGSPAASREALQELTPEEQTGDLRELHFFKLGQFASTGWNTLPVRNQHDPIDLNHIFHIPPNKRQNTVVVAWGSNRGRTC